MGVITIEFADRIDEPCRCCSGREIRLTRFVYSDGDAYAAYYATFSDEHPDRMVSVVVSLGEWGEGGMPEDRLAFALAIRATASEYQVMVVDSALSPWHGATFLGRMLDRDEALKHPWIEEVFHITDHIVTTDPEVRGYLDGKVSA